MNALPFIGWGISFVLNVSLAVPFWICWTLGGIGETYFGFLPNVYHKIPFWHCVGLFIVMEILRSMVPKIASSERTNTNTN